MAASALNYYIGKGVVSFAKFSSGETPGTARDLGNVPEFEMTPNLETLDHFSSRVGVKTKDRSIVLSKSLAIRLVMEEWTVENIALVMLGTVASTVVEIFAQNSIEGELTFVGANEIGATVEITLYKVSFQPGSSLAPISDEWGSLEIAGESLALTTGANAGKIGTIDVTPPA